jgi:anti-sigma regulatory factor (Ser/Thr protein kinase)
MRAIENIVIINKVDELPVLAGKIEELSEKWKLPMALTMNLNLVLEEAVSNVIFYAFKDQEKHEINISFLLEENILTIEISDEGTPFDPTAFKKPDLSLPAEERPIGGLGIFLITKNMDSVKYARNDNKNILTLIKNI